MRVKHTLQKKVSYLQQASLFNRVVSGSNLIIWVSGTDPVSTLLHINLQNFSHGDIYVVIILEHLYPKGFSYCLIHKTSPSKLTCHIV